MSVKPSTSGMSSITRMRLALVNVVKASRHFPAPNARGTCSGSGLPHQVPLMERGPVTGVTRAGGDGRTETSTPAANRSRTCR